MSILDETRTTTEYAGLYVSAHLARPNIYKDEEVLQYTVGDRREGGVNIMPGATWFRTREEALQAIDVYKTVDGDAQKFWHLWRAIHPRPTHEEAVAKYEAEQAKSSPHAPSQICDGCGTHAADLPFAVVTDANVPGMVTPTLMLKRFATEPEAREFIKGLEGHEDGRFYTTWTNPKPRA